jgi:hypothetical protein
LCLLTTSRRFRTIVISPFERSMVFPVVVILLALCVWLLRSGRPKKGFLPDFAKVLDRPEFVEGSDNRLLRRSFLKGEFRGRKVAVMLQLGWRRYQPMVVVSMGTHAAATMESYQLTGFRGDREGELALFALEVTHELKLRHEDSCLKAKWAPFAFPLMFSPTFDPPKWQSVLEAMHTLAGSLERRASSPAVSAAR